MEKIRESKFDNSFIKVYKSEKTNNARQIINDLSPDFVVDAIKVYEAVERDMKTIDGEVYSVEEFLKNYEAIKQIGSDLSYAIQGLLNSMPVRLGFADNRNEMSLVTIDESIEIDALFQKKNKGLGL